MNKDICKRCVIRHWSNQDHNGMFKHTNEIWTWAFLSDWDRGVVFCPVVETGTFTQDGHRIENGVPENCPYTIEHVISE
jgi:hypothetical protein